MNQTLLSRRDFLKLAGLGAGTLALSACGVNLARSLIMTLQCATAPGHTGFTRIRTG